MTKAPEGTGDGATPRALPQARGRSADGTDAAAVAAAGAWLDGWLSAGLDATGPAVADRDGTDAALRTVAAAGWTVLSDLHRPGRATARLDHVAVGPGGIVLVDALRASGTATVIGGTLRVRGYSRTPDVASVADAAGAVTALLAPSHRSAVRAVVALPGRDLGAEPVAGGAVAVGDRRLSEHLLGLPRVLADAEVPLVVEYLRAELAGPASPEQLTVDDVLHPIVRRPGEADGDGGPEDPRGGPGGTDGPEGGADGPEGGADGPEGDAGSAAGAGRTAGARSAAEAGDDKGAAGPAAASPGTPASTTDRWDRPAAPDGGAGRGADIGGGSGADRETGGPLRSAGAGHGDDWSWGQRAEVREPPLNGHSPGRVGGGGTAASTSPGAAPVRPGAARPGAARATGSATPPTGSAASTGPAASTGARSTLPARRRPRGEAAIRAAALACAIVAAGNVVLGWLTRAG